MAVPDCAALFVGGECRRNGVDFSDAFDNLETAFTVHFEASKGRWGLLADASYLNLAGSQDIDTPGQTADVEVENLILEGAGGYEFADTWWVIAGVRYFKLDSDIGFQLQIAPDIEVDESWTDFFAGVIWRPQLGKRWKFSGRFDIGAGGSDLVWNASAVIDYRLGKWAAVFAGYRHLDYDYENQNAGIKYGSSGNEGFRENGAENESTEELCDGDCCDRGRSGSSANGHDRYCEQSQQGPAGERAKNSRLQLDAAHRGQGQGRGQEPQDGDRALHG
jgi:hypothetical protein